MIVWIFIKCRNELISSHPQYSANASPVQLENAAFNRSNNQVSHVGKLVLHLYSREPGPIFLQGTY